MARFVEHLLQPTGLLWLLLCGTAVGFFRSRQRVWGCWFGVAALLLWIVGATPLPAQLVASLERPYVAAARNPPLADAVVMLGGTHDFAPRALVSVNFAASGDRVMTALELIRLGRAPALLLGGSSYDRYGEKRPESELLMAWMREWHLPTGELIPLEISASTRDEATQVAQLVRQRGWHRVLLVTSAGHLRRSVATFQRAGVEVFPVGCDFDGLDALDHPDRLWCVVPRASHLDWFQSWFHEQAGWWWYRLRGWV